MKKEILIAIALVVVAAAAWYLLSRKEDSKEVPGPDGGTNTVSGMSVEYF